MREELLGPSVETDDASSASRSSLRPRTLAEFVGQRELKEHLEIILEAARRRSQAVDHVLLAGPPGLGKTSLAGIIAAEMGVAIHVTSGPAIERAGDLAAMLSQLGEGDVLFIDEIHRLPRVVEEVLYPAMEDFQIDIVLGQGPGGPLDPARPAPLHAGRRDDPHRLDHRAAARPLRPRRSARLLQPADLEAIVARAAGILGVSVDAEGAREIAGRARGTPRIANRLLRRVRDFAEVQATAGRPGHRLGRAGHLRRRRARPRQGRPRHPVAICGGSAAARSGCRRSPSASASRPRRSRTSTSRSSSSGAC